MSVRKSPFDQFMADWQKVSAPFKLVLRLLGTFCRQELPKSGKEYKTKRERREARIVTVFSSALTLAGFKSDDLWITIPCLIAAALCFVWLCIFHWRRPWLVPIILGVFVLLRWRVEERMIEAQRDDVFNRLVIEMAPIYGGAPFSLLYTVRNPAGLTIKRHQATCLYNKIVDSGSGGFMIAPNGVTHPWIEDRPISGNGDGITDRCNTDFMKFAKPPIICADVTVKFTYELEVAPGMQRTKPMRFIANKAAGPVPFWYQESVNVAGNFCDSSANVE